MAKITASTDERIFNISAWLGLHESPDGDTKLKMGEAAAMKNFAITRDGNLRRRPGTKMMIELSESAPVKYLWSGRVADADMILAACNGHLWKITAGEEFTKTDCGTINTDGSVFIFPFNKKAYILDGNDYKVWDGTTLSPVVGYRPLVSIAVPPEGGGELLEGINKLNGLRRSWFSPDGTATVFQLPEKGIASVDYVKSAVDGSAITGWTANVTDGTVTFTTAPTQGVSTIEIGWSNGTTFRSQVTSMRYAELFDGTQDTRVFLYGNGSNQAFYSELDYNGDPSAEYFPDLNVVGVGAANTPITAMIRHYSTLVCYKSDSTWAISASSLDLADGILTRAYYVTPINRAIGNEAYGQAQLVLNSPRTVFGSDIYEWHNNSSYSSNLSVDERQAKRITDRVFNTIKKFYLPECVCYDDNFNQEYYVCFNDMALVHNYAVDAWYYYEGIDATAMRSIDNELYFGTSDGKLMHMSYQYLSDYSQSGNIIPIVSYWESGSMSFGRDYMRKYSAQIWIGVKPESGSKISVTVQTDRKSSYIEKDVETDLAGFARVDFGAWSFRINRKPQMKRMKIKAKKFVFYKLIFEGNIAGKTATVLAADIRVRYTGNAK